MAKKREAEVMLDPIAYRSDYNPEDIAPEYRSDPNIPGVGPQNANLNYQEYGDDSNPAFQQQLGGLNPKYEGTGVMNTEIDYNPNITTADLDPNYLYGEDARNQNSKEAGYIARRNDNIASALYNEGKVTRQDVANYLSQQSGWQNATDIDRSNTVESIWKRMGNMGEKSTEEVDESRLESIRGEDTSGTLYGKTTANEGNPEEGIVALSDENSVYKTLEESRIAEVKSLLSMGVDNVAVSIWGGVNPVSETAMRDYQMLYPELWSQVQQKVKELQGQANVTAISTGGNITTTADRNTTSTEATSYAVNNASLSVSATQLLQSIDSILASSEGASNAESVMDSLAGEMSKLKNRLMNLNKEANSVFKGDVPDYIVKAYMNNRSQEIQDTLSILESRYNAAFDRYKTELSHAEWKAEYDLKKESLELDRYKEKNTSSSSTESNSQDGRMRTERNNNPTAMTTDYAKMMGLELGVDYEIGDSFVGQDGRTYYTAKFLGDPVETAIKAFDLGAANNVFANEGGVLGHWHLGISNQQWLAMTDKEKREVIDKILQKEGGKMDNMAYYSSSWKNNEKSELPEGWSYDWENDVYTDYYRMTADEWGKLSNQARSEVLAGFDNDYEKFLTKKKLFNEEVVKKEGQAQGLEVLRAIAQLYNMASDENGDLDLGKGVLGFYPWRSVKDKFDQIKELLKLDKMISARKNGVSFGQVTEGEWRIIENAASALNWWRTDEKINDRMEETISALWHTTFGKEMTENDWNNFIQEQKRLDEWNTKTENDKLDQIGTGTVNTGVNFLDVVQNGR